MGSGSVKVKKCRDGEFGMSFLALGGAVCAGRLSHSQSFSSFMFYITRETIHSQADLLSISLFYTASTLEMVESSPIICPKNSYQRDASQFPSTRRYRYFLFLHSLSAKQNSTFGSTEI